MPFQLLIRHICYAIAAFVAAIMMPLPRLRYATADTPLIMIAIAMPHAFRHAPFLMPRCWLRQAACYAATDSAHAACLMPAHARCCYARRRHIGAMLPR